MAREVPDGADRQWRDRGVQGESFEAANSQDRMAADLAAKGRLRPRSSAQAGIRGHPRRAGYTAMIRPLLPAAVIIYFWKVIVWDKVLGLGNTDPITGMIANWAGFIITAYVGGRSIEKVARIFRGRL